MVKIYTGTTITEDLVPTHPFLAVIRAKQFVKDYKATIHSTQSWVSVTSNNVEYLTYIQAYCQTNGVIMEWYLDGKLSDSETVYADFDRALDLTIEEFKHIGSHLN